VVEAHKLTRNQRLVLDRLEKAGTPQGAYAILGELRDEGLRSPLQVYRALDQLIARGLVHRVESLNAFVACCHHAHHRTELVALAICDDCGSVDEIDDPAMQARIGKLCEDLSFQPSAETLELRGRCRNCQDKS